MCSMRVEPRIETERLVLRPPRRDDAARIFDLIADYDIVRMLSRVPWPYTLDHARDYVARVQTLDPVFDQPLSIEHRHHGLIGATGFHSADGARFPEVGYWIAREHWGQGYATEATTAALRWAHQTWGQTRHPLRAFQR